MRIDTPLRTPVKIDDNHGWAAGRTGIYLGHGVAYDTVKVGFVDGSGEYTGEYTRVPRAAASVIADAPKAAAARQTPVTRAAIVSIVSRATAAVFDVVAYAALRLYALVTVNAYLVGRGHGAAARKRWGSAFGRAAAKASRKAGMEPTRLREVTTTGRTATAFAYAGRDVKHLDAAYDLYVERLRFEDATR